MEECEMDATKEAERYQGWANVETWSVHLILTNDEKTQHFWEKSAQKARSAAIEWAKDPDHFPKCWTQADHAKYALAGWLKEKLEFNAERWGSRASQSRHDLLYYDLLTCALSRVDWHEVAAAFLEEE
jgi:hypothetical protein